MNRQSYSFNLVGIGKNGNCSLQSPLRKFSIGAWKMNPGLEQDRVPFCIQKNDQVNKKQQHDTLIKGRHYGNVSESEGIFC